jgi:hypothetical protein
MFYLEHLLKKYGRASRKETKPEGGVVSVKFKPGKEPKKEPVKETIDLATGKPHRATYAPGGPKAEMPVEVKAMKKVKEKVWDIPAAFWKKKLSEDELSKVNDTIDKVAQGPMIEEHLARKAIANVRAGKAKPMNPLAAEGLRKEPILRKEYLRAVGQPRPEERRSPAPRKPTPKDVFLNIPKTYWKKKLSEDGMSFLDNAIEKIAKKRYSAAAKERMGVRAPGTPQKVEDTYEAIKDDPKAMKQIRERKYKGRSPKSSAAAIAWSSYKKSKKANYDVPTILEKIGAAPNLVETAKELERLSEEAGRKTLLDFWQRLGRAAMSAKILATPEVRSEMMRERGLAGAAIGAPLGGLIGYAAKPGLTGALTGAAIGAAGAGTLGAYLARRKSQRAAQLLKDPAAQRALVSELARSIQERRPAELL